MAISTKFIKPNADGIYQVSQAGAIYGLWTPYGIISPLVIGSNPDDTLIVYAQQPGATFKDAQKKKIAYVEDRGVKVDIMPLSMNNHEDSHA